MFQSYFEYILLIINILYNIVTGTYGTFWNVGSSQKVERRFQSKRLYIIDIQFNRTINWNLCKYVPQCYS
jgi:hypothetical protein